MNEHFYRPGDLGAEAKMKAWMKKIREEASPEIIDDYQGYNEKKYDLEG